MKLVAAVLLILGSAWVAQADTIIQTWADYQDCTGQSGELECWTCNEENESDCNDRGKLLRCWGKQRPACKVITGFIGGVMKQYRRFCVDRDSGSGNACGNPNGNVGEETCRTDVTAGGVAYDRRCIECQHDNTLDRCIGFTCPGFLRDRELSFDENNNLFNIFYQPGVDTVDLNHILEGCVVGQDHPSCEQNIGGFVQVLIDFVYPVHFLGFHFVSTGAFQMQVTYYSAGDVSNDDPSAVVSGGQTQYHPQNPAQVGHVQRIIIFFFGTDIVLSEFHLHICFKKTFCDLGEKLNIDRRGRDEYALNGLHSQWKADGSSELSNAMDVFRSPANMILENPEWIDIYFPRKYIILIICIRIRYIGTVTLKLYNGDVEVGQDEIVKALNMDTYSNLLIPVRDDNGDGIMIDRFRLGFAKKPNLQSSRKWGCRSLYIIICIPIKPKCPEHLLGGDEHKIDRDYPKLDQIDVAYDGPHYAPNPASNIWTPSGEAGHVQLNENSGVIGQFVVTLPGSGKDIVKVSIASKICEELTLTMYDDGGNPIYGPFTKWIDPSNPWTDSVVWNTDLTSNVKTLRWSWDGTGECRLKNLMIWCCLPFLGLKRSR